MKAILFAKDKTSQLKEITEPVLLDRDHAIIKVAVAGLCGSDLNKIRDASCSLEGKILGHEFAGIVEDIADNQRVYRGERVVVNPLVYCSQCLPCQNGNYGLCEDLKIIGRDLDGGFAEKVVVPIRSIYPLQPRVKNEEAIFADVLACAIHSWSLSGRPDKQRVAIIGDGTMGLTLCALLSYFGNEVTVVGKHNLNLNKAASFGAKKSLVSSVSNPLEEFDCVYEAVGRDQGETLKYAMQLVKRRGNIVVLGVYNRGYFSEIPFRDFFYKEARLLGSNCHGTSNGINEFELALKIMMDRPFDLASLITHRLPLKDFEKGVRIAQNKFEAIKVIYYV